MLATNTRQARTNEESHKRRPEDVPAILQAKNSEGTLKNTGLSHILWQFVLHTLVNVFLYTFSSDPLKMMGNQFRELAKVVQMMSANLINDIPVYRLIAMDGDIPEANRFCQTFSQGRFDDLKFLENFEVLGHGRGRSCVSFGNQMRGDINRKLDCTLEIQRDDVLYVRVANELIRRRGGLPGNPLDATPERFQFGFD